MGDTFFVKQVVFYGHAVERSICYWGATTLGVAVAPEGKVAARLLSCFRRQPQDRLQMEATFPARRATRLARPVPSAQADAAPAQWVWNQTNRVLAWEAFGLGPQEAARAVAVWRASSAESANDRPVAQTIEFGGCATPPSAESLCAYAPPAEPSPVSQSGVDGGFQRLVPHWQRRTLRAVDRAGFVQPLRIGGEAASHPTLATGSRRVYRAFPVARDARDYSRGQWCPLCIERAGWAFPIECLVDAPGHPSAVYAASTSSGQRGPRTVPPGDEAGNDTAGRLDSAGTTTSHDDLAQRVQSNPAPRGAGAKKTKATVSPEPPSFSKKAVFGALPTWRSGSTSAQQRGDPLGRAQTFCGGSIRWTKGRSERFAAGSLVGLFFQTPDWPPPSTGRRGDASRSLSASSACPSQSKSVTYVLASKCHPCVGTVPSPTLSPISWRRGRRMGVDVRTLHKMSWFSTETFFSEIYFGNRYKWSGAVSGVSFGGVSPSPIATQ